MSTADPKSLLARLWLGVYLVLFFALGVVAVLSFVSGEVLAGVAALLAVFANLAGTPTAIAAIAFCFLVGAPLAGLLAAGMLAMQLLTLAGAWRRRTRSFDLADLAATSVPPDLAEGLGTADGWPLSTRTILGAAVAANPGAWRGLLSDEPGADAFDGPMIELPGGVRCTQYAAEALRLAGVLSEQLDRRLDLQLLAASAVVVPLSVASEWRTDGSDLERVVRVSPEQWVAGLKAFARAPAGADVLRRAEIETTVPGIDSPELREGLVGAKPEKVHALMTLISAVAIPLAAGALLLDLLRWLVGLPWRLISLPAVARRRFAGRERGRLWRRWHQMVGPWSGWPASARVAWLGARPLLGLAAVTCVLVLSDTSIWVDLGATAVTLASLRLIRAGWASLLVAALVATVSPTAAVLLVVRLALIEAVLLRLGRGAGPLRARPRGLAAVAESRRVASTSVLRSEAPGLTASRAAFLEASGREDEDTVLETAADYAVDAWANFRWIELGQLGLRVVRGVYRSQWAGAPDVAGVDRELMPLALLEEFLDFALRWLLVGIVACASLLLLPPAAGPLGPGGFWGHVATATATAMIAAPLVRRNPSYFSALLGAGAGWLLTGSRVWQSLALAVLASAAARAVRPLAEAFSITGRGRWQRWPLPPGTPWRLRGHWKAASRAADAGREETAVELLKGLAVDAGLRERQDLRAAALARAALLEVDLGRLQAAADHLEQIPSETSSLSETATVAAGMLAGALGDFGRSAVLLEDVRIGLDHSSPLYPRATMALCDALVHEGRPDEAIELIRERRAEPFALRGVASMLEAQVTVAAALVQRGEGQRAEELLKEAEFFSEADELPLPGDERRRLARVNAQALLLRAQLLMEQARIVDAFPLLDKAIDLVARADDDATLAAARILHGAARARVDESDAAVREIASGIDLLEERRVQLRAADRRTAMIIVNEALYGSALVGLFAAQRRGVPDAAVTGARLIESLRQSALAASFRSRRLPLDETAQELVERERTAQVADDEVARLRELVKEQISDRFADVYLPSTPTPEALRDAARRFGHLLLFYVPPGGLPGWRAWVSPAGEIEIGRVSTGPDGPLAEIAAGGLVDVHTPLHFTAAEWSQAGEVLLPLELRRALLRGSDERPERIVVVPDGPLALVPWAALGVGGRPLIEGGVVQVVPALEMLGSTPPSRPSERVLAHRFTSIDEDELAPLRASVAVDAVDSREAFLGALRGGTCEGVYVASHGRQLGLHQEIEFGDGSTLSAAGALTCKWPRWVVFGSCLVGQVEQVVGGEPFGLAISCMLRGADTVVASVVELTDGGALACGQLAAAVAGGHNPARALRDAQLRRLRCHPLSSLADGLGLVCISATAIP